MPKDHDISSCAARLLDLARRSQNNAVRAHMAPLVTIARHARCSAPTDALPLLCAIMAVRNDSDIYWWAARQRPWRLIVLKTLVVLRTVLANLPVDDTRRDIFLAAIVRLNSREINS